MISPNVPRINPTSGAVPNPVTPCNNPTTTLAQKTLDGTTNYWLTTGNILRAELATGSATAAIAAIASYVFSGAVTAVAGPIVAFALPIPLAILAGHAAWQAYSTPDYDNTLEVASYREKAKFSPLEEDFKKHGKWLSERKIVTQEQFTQKYIDESALISTVPDLLAHHKKLETLIKNTGSEYILPSPKEHNQERLKKACIALSYDETVRLHGSKNIFDWELFSPKNLIINYEKAESLRRGLPSICNFYEQTEKNRKEFDTQNLYSTPHPKRHQKRIQDDCSKMSLKDIDNLHTLPYLFSWSLLSPEEFKIKYQEHAEHLFTTKGINSVIAYYKKTQEALNAANERDFSYEIPHPKSFSKSWMAQDIPLEQTLLHYNVNGLIEYGIIQDPSHGRALQNLQTRYESLLVDYRRSSDRLNENFEKNSLNENRRFEREEQSLRGQLEFLEKNQKEKNLRIRDVLNELSQAKQRGDIESSGRLEEKLLKIQQENFIDGLFTPSPYSITRSLVEVESLHNSKMRQIEKQKTTDIFNLGVNLAKGKRGLEDEYKKVKEDLKK
ncbi:MAG: hypothetical protein V4489_06660 [Chlamydiota bacterium]